MTDSPPWNRVKELFQAALELEPAERDAFVRRACAGDAALQAEVVSLLAALDRAGAFIEGHAIESVTASVALAAGRTLDGAGRALEPGDALGPYDVLEFVGAGGMGEVYRARDSKLNRDVALKVRSRHIALDADRLARLTREAQVLASLNHPNIAAIYGLEETESVQALVLEHVEGPTLARRITQGRIPLDEALSIARQISEGLEAAHARGIIHRDLKPANIKLRPDGTVKILDFGLAKALDVADAAATATAAAAVNSPTITAAGVIVGTAAYVSPEQVRGKAVDKRADIWAFGCVLFEMLTGERAFRADTVQDTLAAVLNREPDWSLLPAGTPKRVEWVLRRCFEKDPGRRWHDVADARIEIEDTRKLAPVLTRRASVGLALAAVGVVVSAAILRDRVNVGERAPSDVDRSVRRLQIRLPETEALANAAVMPLGLGQPSMAISPDGARLAYVLERQGVTQLYLRAMDQLDGVPVARTEGAFGPFFSPDGRWVGFFADNKVKKVAVGGGEPISLCAAPNTYGGSWGTDGRIVFSTDEGRRPMWVADAGGPCQPVPIKDNGGSWTLPSTLPGGKAAIISNPLAGVGVLFLDTGEFRLLVENAAHGRYAPSGHLIFARAGALHAAPFDLEQLAVRGPPAVIVEGVQMDGQVAVAQAVFSRDGTLVYAPGRAANDATRPVWVDRRGKVQPSGMPPRTYRSLSLSPDGTRLAIVIADPNNDIWVQDLERGTLTRLTSGGNNVQPKWTPDGRRVVFTSIVDRQRSAFSVAADGSAAPERSAGGGNAFSPDGELVTFARGGRGAGMDLYVRETNGPSNPQLFLSTRFTEIGPNFSPDGRYIAYVSDESGQYEVYVRPYPSASAKWQISAQGGQEQIWSRTGKELFYRERNKWMVVPIRLSPAFKAGTPEVLFEGPYVNVGGVSYDVTPDGQRFIVLEPAGEAAARVTHLNVVLNWFTELQQRVPAR